MKKIFFLFLIIHFSLIIANAQWIQQNSGTSANLGSIKFINKYTGWICGAGVILKTTNAGNNWFSLNLPVSKTFFEIHPVDSNVVYCVGMFETIIKTTNGGTNWLVIRDGQPNSNTYYTCYFINQNTGWISGGAEQKILKTTNGGLSFDSIVRNTSGFIKDIYFRDSISGLYCDNAGAVRKSTNGGYNWFMINIPVGSYLYDFRNFTFVNSQTGWLVTDTRKVLKTTDFGSNWDSISNIPYSVYPIHCIFFSSLFTGWAGGVEGYSSLYKTTNGGVNWQGEYIPNSLGGTASIFFINDSIGWKDGNAGMIYHTESSGQPIMKIANNNENLATDILLYQNYPNPFNIQTKIKFNVSKNGKYKLEIFDILGKKVNEIFNKTYSNGYYEITLNATNLSSGIYFYRLSSENNFTVKKFILIK